MANDDNIDDQISVHETAGKMDPEFKNIEPTKTSLAFEIKQEFYNKILSMFPSVRLGILLILFQIGVAYGAIMRILALLQEIFDPFQNPVYYGVIALVLVLIFFGASYLWIYSSFTKIYLAIKPFLRNNNKLASPKFIPLLGIVNSLVILIPIISYSYLYIFINLIPGILYFALLFTSVILNITFWHWLYQLSVVLNDSLHVPGFKFVNERNTLLIVAILFFPFLYLILLMPMLWLITAVVYIGCVKQLIQHLVKSEELSSPNKYIINYEQNNNILNMILRRSIGHSLKRESSILKLVLVIISLGGGGFILNRIISNLLVVNESVKPVIITQSVNLSHLASPSTNSTLEWFLKLLLFGFGLSFGFIYIYLNNKKLEINRQGIKLYLQLFKNWTININYLNWPDITSLALARTAKANETIVFMASSGKKLVINLNMLNSLSDRENILKAIETWAPNLKRDYDTIQALTVPSNFSYTQLWLEALAGPPKRDNLRPLANESQIKHNAYTVNNIIAIGGQGTAYLATDNLTNEVVVLKEFILPVYVDIGVRKKALENFEHEAKILKSIKHPQIVKLIDFFVEDYRAYLVLEYINGISLRKYIIANNVFSQTKVIDIARQIAHILKYLHDLDPPIIHRDLTPDNLIMDNSGLIKIIDFNVAKQIESTATGTIVGKYAYLPPEQFRGQACIQSDIYAFGASLYFLLIGKDPIPISEAQVKAETPQINSKLAYIINKATKINLSERYQNIQDLIDDLADLASNVDDMTPSDVIPQPNILAGLNISHLPEAKLNTTNNIFTPLAKDIKINVKAEQINNLNIVQDDLAKPSSVINTKGQNIFNISPGLFFFDRFKIKPNQILAWFKNLFNYYNYIEKFALIMILFVFFWILSPKPFHYYFDRQFYTNPHLCIAKHQLECPKIFGLIPISFMYSTYFEKYHNKLFNHLVNYTYVIDEGKKALVLDPKSYDACILLSDCYSHNKNYQKVLAYAKQAISINPHNYLGYEYAALACQKLYYIDEGYNYSITGAKLIADFYNINSHNDLEKLNSLLLSVVQKYNLELNIFSYLNYEPELALKTFLKEDNYGNVFEYKWLLQHNDKNLYVLGILTKSIGYLELAPVSLKHQWPDLQKGLLLLEETKQTSPNCASLFALRGNIYLRMASLDKVESKRKIYRNMAVEQFNQALQIEPDNLYALLSKAQINYKLNNYKAARIDLNHILKLNNNPAFIKEAKRLIETMKDEPS